MPELIHDCGKKVRFPSGTEGKTGKCPHCGGRVQVPAGEQPAQHGIRLDPPPTWSEYEAYLRGGPVPRNVVMPQKLMLKTEADELWERKAQIRPSKFFCPSCKERIIVDAVLCTRCGVDFRSGMVLGKNMKLNPKGMTYLEQIPWLKDARQQPVDPIELEDESKKKSTARLKAKAPRRKKKKTRRFK